MDTMLGRTIAGNPILGVLSEADRNRLLTYCSVRDFPQGATVFLQGQAAGAFYVVLTGTIGLSVAADGGAVMDIAGPGALVGEGAVLDRSLHTTSAHTLAPVTAIAIDAAFFHAHLQDRFDAVQAMLAETSARLRGLVHDITELKLQSTTSRLAGYLITLTGAEEGLVSVSLPCEKQFLAERLGMKPESLSRAFAKLRPLGVHSGRMDDIRIDDVAALRRFWQSGVAGWDD